ncbi:hypothetical protein [Halopseudomonas salegens]|uniref:hypothetical protein n=1 Tax=Halopseudomonas salegens TaxID=1434072 RepID=UPI00155F7ADF|nr:hypothetical protein [Halopseudomonas salegens]
MLPTQLFVLRTHETTLAPLRCRSLPEFKRHPKPVFPITVTAGTTLNKQYLPGQATDNFVAIRTAAPASALAPDSPYLLHPYRCRLRFAEATWLAAKNSSQDIYFPNSIDQLTPFAYKKHIADILSFTAIYIYI